MATKAEQLIQLAEDFAKEKGFELSETEKKLLKSVAEGKEADYSSPGKSENKPEKGDTWDKSRSPNVDVIIWLCTDKEASSYLTHRGISITGAKIDGCLDLNYIDCDIPFIFHYCYFTKEIKLRCAKVKVLDFSGSVINGIDATNAEIKSDIILGNKVNFRGTFSFFNARINGKLSLSGTRNKDMQLDLRFAKIGILADERDSWPIQNSLFLEGLVYETIDNQYLYKPDSRNWFLRLMDNRLCQQQKEKLNSRLDWIGLQNLDKNFSPQPYEQLAKVLKLSGYEEAAITVLIHKENDCRKHDRIEGIGKFGNWLLRIFIGHGYRPKRVFWYIIPVILLGSCIFSCGNSKELMIPSNSIETFISDTNSTTNTNSTTVNPKYPKFNAFMYSVDTFVPIINFHQQDYWLPNANKNGGSLLRWYLWFHIVMGWFLSSLWVAGFTGLVRRLE